jgi:branched-chain amino acid transport system substrate-binding protein
MNRSPYGNRVSVTRRSLLGGTGAALVSGRVRALTAAEKTIKIGVLTDMSGPYKDLGGPNVVTCIKQAVQDFDAANRGINVEVVFADHQNKPDVGTAIALQWLDREGVDCIADINNSAVAIALTSITRERDKIQLNTGAGSSDIIGKYCTPNLVHWTFDSWQITHATCVPMVNRGGKTWFFITANYAFGHSTERDATAFITGVGGKVIGSAAYPFPETTDFSSMIVQAQASGAQVLGLATSGADNINVIKQAAEFGLIQKGMQIAGLGMYINDVHALGMETSQGLVLSEMFYWNHNDRTRAFSARVQPKMSGVVPNHEQAGGYSGVFNYLKAVSEIGVARAKKSGRDVVEVLKRMDLDDDALGPGKLRVDGQALHPAYLHQVKKPSESTGPWDVYNLLATVSADQAFRPLSEEACQLGKG